MRLATLTCSVLLLCLVPLVFLLWCLLSPPLLSYHPFHPNHPHLPSSYVDPSAGLSGSSPSFLLSSAIVPSSYIEGWYLKLRTAGGRHFALIYMYFVSSQRNDSTAAITLLDAHNERSHIYKYPIEHFRSSPLPGVRQSLHFLSHSSAQPAPPRRSPYHDFELHIGNNTMSPYAVSASLSSAGQSEAWVSAEVQLTLDRSVAAYRVSESYQSYPWSTVFSPDSHTVGLFAFLPLACYQQVIELQLAVSGHMAIDGQHVDLTGATAYYEKTRGSTFPDSYLWLHASHFTDERAAGVSGDAASSRVAPSLLSSFFFSLASVPILPTSARLPGFVCSFVLGGRSSHFATQLGSVLTALRIDERTVEFVLYDQHFTTRVAVTVTRHTSPVNEESWLWAARNGHLQRVIPQQIGRDSVQVAVQHVIAPQEGHSLANSTDSPQSRSTESRSTVELDALSFTSHGYSFSHVAWCSSSSVGLEVFVHERELQQQVGAMYEEVKPWLAQRYFPLHTPLVSFSISNSFLRSVLPEQISSVTDRLTIRHTLLALSVSIVAVVGFTVLSLLMLARRRKQKLKAE